MKLDLVDLTGKIIWGSFFIGMLLIILAILYSILYFLLLFINKFINPIFF